MLAASRFKLALFAFALTPLAARADEPFQRAELIFPLEHWHNHGSCVVEAPNGDLVACWFHGSGERKEDDVLIEGARRKKGSTEWSARFVMADVPGFPDTNCCMIVDPNQKLWLLWPTILAHTWESALMKYRVSGDYQGDGPPKWDSNEVLHMRITDDFKDVVVRKCEEYVKDSTVGPLAQMWTNRLTKMAGDETARRLGWFTRAHPLVIDGNRMLVGLYSDGFSFSLVAITDDWGKTWTFSEPIVGGGNIQPSFAQRKDGSIVCFMRDNGPPPKRILVSESRDRGQTWSKVEDHPTLANPGAGLELARINNGDWVVIYNDLEDGRNSLAVSLSDDEGKSWKWTRHLEKANPGEASYAYPSIIQAADGTLHATYSYALEKVADGGKNRKSIKHAEFNEAWLKAGDPN